jgi:hypothetical protein
MISGAVRPSGNDRLAGVFVYRHAEARVLLAIRSALFELSLIGLGLWLNGANTAQENPCSQYDIIASSAQVSPVVENFSPTTAPISPALKLVTSSLLAWKDGLEIFSCFRFKVKPFANPESPDKPDKRVVTKASA